MFLVIFKDCPSFKIHISRVLCASDIAMPSWRTALTNSKNTLYH